MLLDWTIPFFNFQENWQSDTCFYNVSSLERQLMYIIRNKIRVGMEGGPYSIGGPYFTGEYGPPGPYSGGSIFNMTPGLVNSIESILENIRYLEIDTNLGYNLHRQKSVEFEWGVSNAIFRARTYNCITHSVR